MCNCRELPSSVAEPENRGQILALTGISLYQRYFVTPDSNRFEPPLDYSHFLYCCMECGQRWYLECTPEESPHPSFALKVNETTRLPSDELLQAVKQYLCILAHGGFDSEKCRAVDCQNHKLLGRELCHLHIPFP